MKATNELASTLTIGCVTSNVGDCGGDSGGRPSLLSNVSALWVLAHPRSYASPGVPSPAAPIVPGDASSHSATSIRQLNLTSSLVADFQRLIANGHCGLDLAVDNAPDGDFA